MKDIIKNKLNETFSKTEKDEINKETTAFISSKDFEKKIEKIITQKLKNNKELEDKITEITKDVITKVYKALWQKASFWKSAIK